MEQVIFKMDKKLKAQIAKKAKKEGVSMSDVFKSAGRAYVEDQFEVGLVYSKKLIRDVRQAQKEIREGKVFYGDLDELVKKV